MQKIKEILKFFQDEEIGCIKLGQKMEQHTTMHVGGGVHFIIEPKSISEVEKIINYLEMNDQNYKIIGNGSNLLFPDYDMDIVIIKINNTLKNCEINGEEIIVGAGFSLRKLARQVSKIGLSGLEFSGGIPGTVGGAIFMNAGAHSGEMKDVIKEVLVYDIQSKELKWLKNEICQFNYRTSIFKVSNGRYVILEAKLKLTKNNDSASIFKRMSGNLAYRQLNQPLEFPSCGSIFTNPENNHAGKIIDELGLKGKKIGNAEISPKHANFIVNLGAAKQFEIVELIEYVQTEASSRGYNLHSEVEIVFAEKAKGQL